MPFVRPALRVLDRLAATLGRAPRKAPHLASGSRGEEEAYFYLRKLWFVIVARDYRSPRRRGDIDLIAWEGDRLCFIEVKTRGRRNFMAAEAAVDEEKKATVSGLAREYLRHRTNSSQNRRNFASTWSAYISKVTMRRTLRYSGTPSRCHKMWI